MDAIVGLKTFEETVYGVRLHGIETGSGPGTLLFLHGWCGNHASFKEQIKQFLPTHRCIAIDLPGHGRSAKPQIDYSIVFFAEIINGLIQKLGLRDSVVVGHSMGGCIAVEMLHQDPDTARGAVLVDPAMILPTRGMVRSLNRSHDAMREHGVRETYWNGMKRYMLRADDPEEISTWLHSVQRRVPIHVALTAWQGMIDWNGRAALKAASEKPLAYIAAEYPNNHRAEMKRAVPSLFWGEVLAGSHHCHLSEPVQVNAMMTAFLRRIG